MINGIPLASFFLIVTVCFVSFFIALMLAWYVVRSLMAEGYFSPKAISYAIFWLFVGLSCLFSGLSLLANGLYTRLDYDKTYDLLSFQSIVGFGYALIFHTLYKNTFRRWLVFVFTVGCAILGVIYSYLLIDLPWIRVEHYGWGHVLTPPFILIVMSIYLAALFVLAALADFFIRFIHWTKNKTEESWNEFLSDAAIILSFGGLAVDILGMPGWTMVIDRIVILVAIMLAVVAVYKTSYIENTIAQERRTEKRKEQAKLAAV